ncbi:MAG TPA: nucleotidyltransferase [Candidatus Mediterraneibacter intestinavium]|nr:nucleotidyltransferase [Candidatus Mediterraneibacter intestinavium]
MSRATLVIMAAGIGSRFGGGIKQLAPVGPNGEIIMDYSIYDAVEAGFDKVVFVIRRDLEKDFREVIGNRIEKYVDVAYAYQEVDDIPEKYSKKFAGRTKPWGTGQAILCCKDVVDSPFLVINADDYYGKEAYREAYRYLTESKNADNIEICMVGFVLKNTLSENGGVTRGLCEVDENGMLTRIVETQNIEKDGGSNAVIRSEEGDRVIDAQSPVSMNMWGLRPGFFDILESRFDTFLDETREGDLKAEYLLPTLIGQLLEEGRLSVRVLKSRDQWFGVTYKEDREAVVNSVSRLVEEGLYPPKLYTDK